MDRDRQDAELTWLGRKGRYKYKCTVTKGQTISKANYGVLNSPKNPYKNPSPEYFIKRRCSG